jgi:type IV pilus assembly protein PilW
MRRQTGLTLIEFMIAIVLGMVVVAAMAVLIANQSAVRSEVDRAGRMIENGRYSMQTLSDDLLMAGYWGEMSTSPDAPTGLTAMAGVPNPCVFTLNAVESNPGDATTWALQEATYLYVQGYDDSAITSSLLTSTLTCVSNWKTGTDILVVRRVDPDASDILTGGAVDLTKLSSGQVYVQTGLSSATGTSFGYRMNTGSSATNNATNFPLVTKSGALATPRKLVVHIYYVATCDVCSGAGVDTIPTLKRVELTFSGGAPASTTAVIAEGVENLQFEYGVDSLPNPGTGSYPTGDGSPDSFVNAADGTLGSVGDNWRGVVSAKIFLVTRSTDKSPGYTDTRQYCLKTTCSTSSDYYTPSTADAAYQRHLFTQSIRLANPSMRRSG